MLQQPPPGDVKPYDLAHQKPQDEVLSGKSRWVWALLATKARNIIWVLCVCSGLLRKEPTVACTPFAFPSLFSLIRHDPVLVEMGCMQNHQRVKLKHGATCYDHTHITSLHSASRMALSTTVPVRPTSPRTYCRSPKQPCM